MTDLYWVSGRQAKVWCIRLCQTMQCGAMCLMNAKSMLYRVITVQLIRLHSVYGDCGKVCGTGLMNITIIPEKRAVPEPMKNTTMVCVN